MSNLHANQDEVNKHTPKGFDNAINNTRPWKDERGESTYIENFSLPRAINFVDGTVAAPTNADGDIYVLIGSGVVDTSWSSATFGDWVRFTNTIATPITPIAGALCYDDTASSWMEFDGSVWAVFVGGGGANYAKILTVDPNGNDGSAVVGDISKPFLTIEAARDAASSGDLIEVNPGTYTKTTTDVNGFSKEGVDFYYHPNTFINITTANPVHSNSGFATPSRIFGYCRFIRTAVNAYIYTDEGVDGSHFEAQDVSSSTTFPPIYTKSISSVESGYILVRGEVFSSGSKAIETFRTNGTIKCGKIRSTASYAINGNQQSAGNNLFIEAELIESTANTAILIDRAHITAKKISGTTYGLDTGAQFNGIIALSCSDIDSIRCTLGGKVDFHGYAQNMTAVDGEITGGTTSEIDVTGVDGKIITKFVDANSANRFITVSDGECEVSLDLYPSSNCRITQTGGELVLIGQSKADISDSGFYSNTSSVNGGVCRLRGLFKMGGANYFMKVNGGTLDLGNSRIELTGDLTSTVNNCINYESGKLISNGCTIVVKDQGFGAVNAVNPSLDFKVLSGGFNTNTVVGSVLGGNTNKFLFTVSAASLVTSLNLDDQVNPLQNFSTPADTKSNMAAALVGLINVSGLNMTASQDNVGVDEYFYVESTVAGTAVVETGRVNLGVLTQRSNSYPMTNTTGGLIIQDIDVE